ncbi:helix-turn-helix transcriptional regulator [Shewanella algae]|uniref:helix-turn-helix domain-containing protein n=1 Tax=Shewanella algae TaxID=38313 RepID=UPI001AAD4946|nr:helix-turn-helix transcriptional regulator [Shewanella algae]MBO2655103.1 helix-turn-helix transcriptional regulator [Shewanella algae]
MKFSSLIKSYRIRNSLSQEELAQLLSVVELSNRVLDAGTISRWERGVCAPPLKNQIRITRKLSMRVSSRSLHQTLSMAPRGVDKLKQRFNRASRLSDNFYNNAKPRLRCVLSEDLIDFFDDSRLIDFSLDAYNINFNCDEIQYKLELLSCSDDAYPFVLKFYNKSGVLAGHSVCIVSKTRDVIEFLKCVKGKVSACSMQHRLNGYTLINVSSYANNFCSYLFMCKHLFDCLDREFSVDWYIGNSFINEDWQIMKSLGASIVSKGDTISKGGVKVGGNRYRSLLYCADACALLASSLANVDCHDITSYGFVDVCFDFSKSKAVSL